jgi:hypothetical protein
MCRHIESAIRRSGSRSCSDEYGSKDLTFHVYFRPDEIPPELFLGHSHKITRSAARETFRLTTSRETVDRVGVDWANSTTCHGNYLDGNWVRSNPNCEEHIVYGPTPVPWTG